MKAKTIQQNIQQKMSEFAGSIDNNQLASDVLESAIVTGGCITSMFLREPVNDYDVYFDNHSVVFRLSVYYINKIKSDAPLCIRLTFESPEDRNIAKNHALSTLVVENDNPREDDFWGDKLLVEATHDLIDAGSYKLEEYLESVTRIEIFCSSSGLAESVDTNDSDHHPEGGDSDKEDKYRPVFLSSNAITLTDKIQLVLRFVGDAKKIHESYDFIHATNYWTEYDGLVTNAAALESILAKELVYMGSLYPLASIFRTRKFIQRDWTVHVGNYVKMAMQLNELDLTDVKVLEEQLTGVDSLYLGSVISAIKEKRKNDKNFQFNSQYICELCDRMMGLRKEIEAKELP